MVRFSGDEAKLREVTAQAPVFGGSSPPISTNIKPLDAYSRAMGVQAQIAGLKAPASLFTHDLVRRKTAPFFYPPKPKEPHMITAIIAGIGSATLVLLAWCAIRYMQDVKKRTKKRTKKRKAITDEFHTILTCHLYEHNPQIYPYIRDDRPGNVPSAWMKAHGETYCVTAEPNTESMINKAKQAAAFFETKKPKPWKNNQPQNDAKKGNTMKIIVTGSPTTGPLHGQYEAKKWEVDQDGYLEIFNEDNQRIGMHAPGTWAHVRGYAEEQ